VRWALACSGAAAALLLAALGLASTSATGPAPVTGSALPARLGPSKGAVFYVDGQKGSDRANGSLRRPWRTIEHALAKAPRKGSVVNVRAGTYSTVVIKNVRASARTPVTVRAFPGERVTLTATPNTLENAVSIRQSTGIRVRGFDVSAPASNNGFRIENSTDIEVIGNVIHDNGHMGVLVVGTCEGNAGCNANIQLLGNRFYGNGGYWASQDEYWLKGDHAVYWGAVSDVGNSGVNQGTTGGLIANNLFYDQPTGRHLQMGSQVDGLIVANNTFAYANGDPGRFAGSALQVYGESNPFATRNVRIVNNIIVRARYWAVWGSGPAMPTNVVRNNLLWANQPGDFNAEDRLFTVVPPNPNADPLFEGESARDFRLRASSPGIGKADRAFAPPLDFAGKPRDAAPDLGALEHRAQAR
jgi:hypothetical protein